MKKDEPKKRDGPRKVKSRIRGNPDITIIPARLIEKLGKFKKD